MGKLCFESYISLKVVKVFEVYVELLLFVYLIGLVILIKVNVKKKGNQSVNLVQISGEITKHLE